MTLGTKILEFGPFFTRYGIFCEKTKYFAHLQSNLVISQIFFTKMAITQPKKVQIPKFCCLKSSTNIWPSFRNIYSISKVIKIYLQGRKGSKPAKIGKFLHCKKLKLHFLKNFPRFDLTAFFCDFLHMRPFIFRWQSSWYRTGVMGGMHGWRALHSLLEICSINIHIQFNTLLNTFIQ